MWHVVSHLKNLLLQMSNLDIVSSYNHVYVCDWIHKVFIIMLNFYVLV